jgi:hypothetical protein
MGSGRGTCEVCGKPADYSLRLCYVVTGDSEEGRYCFRCVGRLFQTLAMHAACNAALAERVARLEAEAN